MMASTDLSSLYYLLANSLSTQEQIRKDAEAQLEQASLATGFGVLLLQVAATKDGNTDISVRQAASVYFKNHINKRYDPYDEERTRPLPEEDKAQIRQIILSAVIESSPTVRPQLIAATHKIIRSDFPKRWPNLVEELYPLIISESSERVIASLAIFYEVVSWHGGTATDETRELIHGRVFPVLLGILKGRMDGVANLDRDALTIVKSILKTFYAAIQYRFSTHLLLGESFSTWCTTITHVIQLIPPTEIINQSKEEAEAHLYWKMKKWALRIHNKIFQRYGCSKLDSFNNPDHMPFAKFYMEQVALPVLNVYLAQIESHLTGRNPFNERIFSILCDFLESSLRHKKTWNALESHAMNLVSHFVFPRVCFTEEDQEMWEEDPEEYIRAKLDPFDELYSAQASSVNFVLDLIKCRKKAMFIPILQFINSILSTPSKDIVSLRRKDGALFLLGSISKVLVTSDFKTQIEPVISSFVLPELSSSHGFLRMRSCWTLEQFDDIEYSEGTCISALQGVLTCLTDKDLPVRVAAAGALGGLLDNETTQKFLPPYLGKVMEAVLALANEIQLDSVAFVLERLVQMFSEDLAPYAVQLCIQLRDTVARHLEGYSNVLDVDAEDENFGQNADKMMAVVGMFKAIETLIDSMSKTPELVAGMEEVVMPLLAMVLDRRIIDVYEEIFELIDSITFSRKQISNSLWNLFPYIYRAFKDVGADYIQDMQTTLDNIISYGSATLLVNEQYMQMLLDIIKTTMTEDEFSEQDRVYGCRLMEALMLNCQNRIDNLIVPFIEYVIPTISSDEDQTLTVIVHHLEIIINALYYNAPLTLQALESFNLTSTFFTIWFKKAEKMTRVHDKHLMIVALAKLFTIPFESLPPFLRQNWRFVLPIFLTAVQTLPKALEERRSLQDEEPDSDSDWDDDDNLSEGDYDEVNDDEDEGEDVTGTNQGGQAMKQQSTTTGNTASGNKEEGTFEFNADDDDDDGFGDELEEELFFETPLDKIDMANFVQQTLTEVVHTQPHSFQTMTGALSPDQALFLQSLLPVHQ